MRKIGGLVGALALAAMLGAGHGAAAATGFVDQSHLHRLFRRSLGVTPGEYRRRLATS